MARHSSPEVNAGSMADIAFLLLIFFLVTTTIEREEAIITSLPPEQPDNQEIPEVKERNLFQVLLNKDNQLLVEDEPMTVEELTEAAVAFLDNGGGEGASACNYCQGDRDEKSSVNPEEAVISFVNDRQAKYNFYLSVMNELQKAYTILRNREAERLYNESFESLKERKKQWPADQTDSPEYQQLEEKINRVKDLFPYRLSEAEPQNTL